MPADTGQLRPEPVGGEVGGQGTVGAPGVVELVLLEGSQGAAEQVLQPGDEGAQLRSGGGWDLAEGDVLSCPAQLGVILGPELGQEAGAGGGRRRLRVGADRLGHVLDQGLRFDLGAEVATDPELDAAEVEGVVAELDLLAAQVGADGVAVALQGRGAELVDGHGLEPEEQLVQTEGGRDRGFGGPVRRPRRGPAWFRGGGGG